LHCPNKKLKKEIKKNAATTMIEETKTEQMLSALIENKKTIPSP